MESIAQTVREKTCCHHQLDYSFQIVARNVLYVPSHRQDNIYQGLWYTSRGTLAGMFFNIGEGIQLRTAIFKIVVKMDL